MDPVRCASWCRSERPSARATPCWSANAGSEFLIPSFRGASVTSEPGISRFRVRCFASPRNGADTHILILAARYARALPEKSLALDDKGRGECRVPNAPVTTRQLRHVERLTLSAAL